MAIQYFRVQTLLNSFITSRKNYLQERIIVQGRNWWFICIEIVIMVVLIILNSDIPFYRLKS